ncbi:acyltransferase [Nocardioides sp. AE5]|uniref:acyltransferase n=1 Tax=Nocardioides sp. AE5 TaxID=2962573 RepID=UPI002882BD0A|nr:acyltransferase [Nocardioides sp. AE5]MDT0202636.1 acyltransferase [Nocardioides sp. AE5]
MTIGDHVTVTGNVQFLTHDGGVWVLRHEHPDLDVFGPISIGNNVFLGFGATILPGISIGDNVVVGAGAVVTRDIPADCVAAGVPARPLRSLDDYRRASVEAGVPTKSMSKDEKRSYLRSKHLQD